ncbi:MAG: hypothetical protein E6I29_06715 [Chloroflexi bacterium]|nr:MAG: hypothetical protein E6I29_06715 [Chloroflexota bacterium]
MVGLDPLPALPQGLRGQPGADRSRSTRPAPRPPHQRRLGNFTSPPCGEVGGAAAGWGRTHGTNAWHRNQLRRNRLPHLLDQALEKAAVQPADLDLVAVTRGPGLVGCLLVGVGVAEGLATAWSKPVTGVNHLWGHIYAAMLARPDLEPPLLGLVVSGAHSDLVRMAEHGRFEVIGRTRDDAAGEAFDKAARMLGLGFPGGPALDRLARSGNPKRQRLPPRRIADRA